MVFKVFGTEGPSDDLADDLRVLLSLDAAAWDSLTDWFLAAESFDLEKALSSRLVAASPLQPQQFRKCASGVLSLLEDWHSSHLELADLQHDLLVLVSRKREPSTTGSFLGSAIWC